MTLTNFPHDPLLDLDPWVGQRQATFRFERFNAVSGLELGEVRPLQGATLSHDTTRTIKRSLSLDFGVLDTASLNTVSDRIRVFMRFPNGTEYPLGVYMFADDSRQQYTSGQLGTAALSDEMFLVDQEIEEGISSIRRSTGSTPVSEMIQKVVQDLPITISMEASPFQSAEAWSAGTHRGQILESLSVSGDYFSPWFDNEGVLRFIRTFDPHKKHVSDFDFDAGNKVIREPIVRTSDLLTAPNRFIVIANSQDDPEFEAVGRYDIPSTAPHSIAQRGFVVPSVQDLQLTTQAQAQAVAEGIGQRMTVFEMVSLTTPPDPRHDSYNIIKWQGDLWLELAWSMALVEGGTMSHLMRKAYLDA